MYEWLDLSTFLDRLRPEQLTRNQMVSQSVVSVVFSVILKQWSGKGAIRKKFTLQKPRWEKTKLTIRL